MTSTSALENADNSSFLIEEGRVSESDVVRNTNIDLNLGGAGGNGGEIVLRRPKVRREL